MNKIILILLFYKNAFATDYSLIIGGGCHNVVSEDMKVETNAYAEKMTKRSWKVEALYGDSVNSQDIKTDVSKGELNEENFIKMLNLQSEKLGSGDKFLLNIITHGGPVEKGHNICLGDGKLYNLDNPKIHAALEKMKARGVRMAFVDNSCYGGESIDIFKEYGCTISLQADNAMATVVSKKLIVENTLDMGVTTTIRNLNLNEEASLEDVYIKSLLNSAKKKLGNFPQISGNETAIGNTASFINYNLTPELHDRLDTYQVLKDFELGDKLVACRANHIDEELKNFIDNSNNIIEKLLFNIREKKYTKGFDKISEDKLRAELIAHQKNLVMLMKDFPRLKEEIAKNDEKTYTQITNLLKIFSKKNPISLSFSTKLTEEEKLKWKKLNCLVVDEKSVKCNDAIVFSDRKLLAAIEKNKDFTNNQQPILTSKLMNSISEEFIVQSLSRNISKLDTEKTIGKLGNLAFTIDPNNAEGMTYKKTLFETIQNKKILIQQKN